VLEGDPGNWAAVAGAISGRVRELGWRQRELADRSHVSVAVAARRHLQASYRAQVRHRQGD